MAQKKPNKATKRCGLPKKAKKNKASHLITKRIRAWRDAGFTKGQIKDRLAGRSREYIVHGESN